MWFPSSHAPLQTCAAPPPQAAERMRRALFAFLLLRILGRQGDGGGRAKGCWNELVPVRGGNVQEDRDGGDDVPLPP